MKFFVSAILVMLSWQPKLWAQGKPATVADLGSYNKPDREQVLYEGAKKEGKLMWYTSLTGGPNTEAPKVFEAKYPGVKMEVYRGDSDALISSLCRRMRLIRMQLFCLLIFCSALRSRSF